MGHGASKEAPAAPAAAADGACPVRSKPKDVPKGHPPAAAGDDESSCPVKNASGMLAKYRNTNVYNVYSQKIDPKNNMPANPNQKPAPGQEKALSTHRVSSNIPKGGTDSTWTYPSPQMFYNAIVRKGKKGSTSEDDMEMVVAIHNNMNERTWNQVMAWEAMHQDADAEEKGTAPRLLRFLGRPDEFSPLARLKMLFGHPAPFDRHDWVVDRGGQEVRYIIDYYHDVSRAHEDEKPALRDESSVKSIVLEVRPALDSPEAFLDRYLRMPLALLQGQTSYQPSNFFASAAMVEAERREKEELAAAERLKNLQREREKAGKRLPAPIAESCGGLMQLVQECSGQEQCTERLVGFQLCAARIACPDAAKVFEQAYAKGDEKGMETHYAGVTECTTKWLAQYAASVKAAKAAEAKS